MVQMFHLSSCTLRFSREKSKFWGPASAPVEPRAGSGGGARGEGARAAAPSGALQARNWRALWGGGEAYTKTKSKKQRGGAPPAAPP